MAAMTDGHSGTLDGQKAGSANKQQTSPTIDELAQARKEVELLKAAVRRLWIITFTVPCSSISGSL